MGRLTRLPSAVLFRLGLITCCGALLTGLLLLMLGVPHPGQAQGRAPAVASLNTPTPTPKPPTATATSTPSPTATATPKPTATSTLKPAPTATSKPRPTSTPKPAATATQPVPTATTTFTLAGSTSTTPGAVPSSTAPATIGPATATPGRSKSALAAAPSWLVGGLVGVFALLLAFSLIIFPLAMRSARSERRGRPAFPLALTVRPGGQVARLTQIPPARNEPLSREQMLALRESQRLAAVSGVSEQSTASLAAIRVVDGVPISLPITEAETVPQLPVAKRSVVSKIVESTTARMPAVRPTPALPPPKQQPQQYS